MLRTISKVLIVLGIIAMAAGVGIHEYFMRTQRLHIEGMTERGVFIGSALFLVGITYAITPGTLAKVLMVLLMILLLVTTVNTFPLLPVGNERVDRPTLRTALDPHISISMMRNQSSFYQMLNMDCVSALKTHTFDALCGTEKVEMFL